MKFFNIVERLRNPSRNRSTTLSIKLKRKNILKRHKKQEGEGWNNVTTTYPTHMDLHALLKEANNDIHILSTVAITKKNPPAYEASHRVLPYFTLKEEDTARFYINNVNDLITRYEMPAHEYAYIIQTVFDNFEWRTLAYYMLKLQLVDSETVVRIKKTGSTTRFVVEKRKKINHPLKFNLRDTLVPLKSSLVMMQEKPVGNLYSVREGRIDICIKDDIFYFTFETSTPPVYNVEETQTRYTDSLKRWIDTKTLYTEYEGRS